MTKHDYIRFAEMLAHTRTISHRELWAVIVNDIADIFAADNKRFNREKFYQACKPKENSL